MYDREERIKLAQWLKKTRGASLDRNYHAPACALLQLERMREQAAKGEIKHE